MTLSLRDLMVIKENSKTSTSTESDKIEEKDFYRRGLVNEGNFCYCNSVIQALGSFQIFREVLINIETESSILKELGVLYKKMGETGTAIPIRKFIQKFTEKNKTFNPYEQQDAHEFFTLLMDILSEEAKKIHVISPTNLFQGVLSTSTKCQSCCSISRRDEEFTSLSLDTHEGCSLIEILHQSEEPELLTNENKFFCDSCKLYVNAIKTTKLIKLPQILVIHFKRFTHSHKDSKYGKSCIKIPFPTTLSLKDENNKEGSFQLMSIIAHIGTSPNYGHYISFVKYNSQWMKLNDEYITIASLDNVSEIYGIDGVITNQSMSVTKAYKPAAYMIFYYNNSFNI